MTLDQAKEILERIDNFLTLNNGNTLNVWLNTVLYQTLNGMLSNIVKKDNPEDKKDDNENKNKVPLVDKKENKLKKELT